MHSRGLACRDDTLVVEEKPCGEDEGKVLRGLKG